MGKQLISVNEIITTSFTVYTKNAKLFVPPIIIAFIPNAIIYVMVQIGTSDLILLALSFIATIVALWVSIVFIYMVDDMLTKKKVNVPSIYAKSTNIFLSFIWINILVGIAVILGLIALIIPGIILSIYYAFAVYVVVLEKKGNKGIAALKYSYHLVLGRWWATFVRLVIPVLLVALIGYFLSVGIFAIINLGNISLVSITSFPDLVFSAISDTIFLILAPLFTAFSLALYRSLIATKGK